MIKLNLGCGKDIKKGYINIDHFNFKGVDEIMDLNQLPLPFEDNSIYEVYMKDVIEHVDEPFKFIEEMYRILKPMSKLYMEMPHFTSASNYNDPTHKTRFGHKWFDCFDMNSNHLQYLTNKKFWHVDVKYCFAKRKIAFPINWFFNKYPMIYEYTPLRVIPCTRLIVQMRK